MSYFGTYMSQYRIEEKEGLWQSIHSYDNYATEI